MKRYLSTLAGFQTKVRCCHRAEEGQDVLEYMIAMPFLLLLVFGILEGGLQFSRYNTVANVAREGARAAILPLSTACNAACVTANARTAASSLAVGLAPAPTIQFSSISASADRVTVTVTYNSPLVTGAVIQALGGQNSLRLQAVAVMQRE